MALLIAGGLITYAVIGVLSSIAFNYLSWKIHGEPSSDDTKSVIIFLWPIFLPLGFIGSLSPIAKNINSRIDRRNRALRDGVPSYDMLKKKCEALEKELAEAILVKGK